MAIAYVGSNGVYSWTSEAQSAGSATSGNVIVGVVYWNPVSAALTSLSTNISSSVSLLSNPTVWYVTYEAAIFSAAINSTGSLTITPTWATAPDIWGFFFSEYSGVDTSTIIEASAIQAQTAQGTETDAYDSGSFNSITNNAVIVGMLGSGDYADAGFSSGTGFSARYTNMETALFYAEDKTLVTAGATNATFTSSTGYADSLVVGLALKPASAGSPTALPRRALNGPFYGSLQGSVR